MLLVPEKMQHCIVMPTLVKVLVHITWKVSAAMDMRLPYWTVVVSTLLVGWTSRASVFMTVLLEMRLGWSVMVCFHRFGFCCICVYYARILWYINTVMLGCLHFVSCSNTMQPWWCPFGWRVHRLWGTCGSVHQWILGTHLWWWMGYHKGYGSVQTTVWREHQ